MRQHRSLLKNLATALILALLSGVSAWSAQDPTGSVVSLSTPAVQAFNGRADQALLAMKARAEELKIKGVALVAYFEGEHIQSWTSKMIVVNSHKDSPTVTNQGANLLGIAYAKAAEMADTLKDSGNAGRKPMTGEFGWQGGLIIRGKSGYLIAAFSGGPSESDLKVSRAGLEALERAGKF
jgi:hypothetical protein